MSLRQLFPLHSNGYSIDEPHFLTAQIKKYHARVNENESHLLKGAVPQSGAVQLTSNDYLNLANQPSIIEAKYSALAEYGHGIVRSDVYRNYQGPQRDFEVALAAFLRAEDVAIAQSGYAVNLGLLQALAEPEIPVYLDMFSHMSLWEGAKSAGAKVFPFQHNNSTSLRHIIERHGPGIVAFEALYSTSGTIAPIKDLVTVASEMGCVIIIDESHSLGTFGPQGAGLVVKAGLANKVHFRTASLSKTFASRGGIVASTAQNIEYFHYNSFPAIFSSGVLAYEAAGYSATLQEIIAQDDGRKYLQRVSRDLKDRLLTLGYNVSDSQSQIVSLIAGKEAATLVLRNALESRGIFGSVFCAPATAKNRSLVRFTLNSGLTTLQLERIVDVCSKIPRC
jgi:CAI-1 autoinducer synthase